MINKDKLMLIVKAVNDSRCYPKDITDPDFLCIAVSKGRNWFYKGEVHSVNDKASDEYWDKICTVEEFNQCVEEMSAGYSSKKESNMKSNKHPHHDLISKWFSDMSKGIQVDTGLRATDDFRWVGRSIDNVMADSDGEYEFRIKPREFVKGHWYPCIKPSGVNGVLIFNGSGFNSEIAGMKSEIPITNMKWIGESLGEINFGGVE